jgi:hypothetical protein
MKFSLFLAGMISFACTVNAQTAASRYTEIDRTALSAPPAKATTTQGVADWINAHFTSPREKVRAIFIWVASTFEYDVENMYALNLAETKEEKIKKVMLLHKGVCENYAAVFDELCQKCGIKSWIVPGYTKTNDQSAELPHGWNVALIDNVYYLFDPTWGSGYINEKRKYVRRIDEKYFMAQPSVLARTHYPFDPMWQLTEHPLTAQEFADNADADKSRPIFSYKDSILVWDKLSHVEQLETEARRTESNGIKTTTGYNYLAYLKNNANVERRNKLADVYNKAVNEYNAAVKDLNTFINYYNKQFTPTRPDTEIKAMLDSVSDKVARVRRMLGSIDGKDEKIDEAAAPLRKNMDEFQNNIKEYESFLTKYFSKPKVARKAMFYRSR